MVVEMKNYVHKMVAHVGHATQQKLDEVKEL